MHINSIETFCHTKTWYNSKAFMSILLFCQRKLYMNTWYIFFLIDFLDILSQNILEDIKNNLAHWYILKSFWFFKLQCTNARISVTSLEQNIWIIFGNNIYIGNIRTVCYNKSYIKTFYSSKSLWILNFCSAWFLRIPPNPKIHQGGNVLIPPNSILLISKCILDSKLFQALKQLVFLEMNKILRF